MKKQMNADRLYFITHANDRYSYEEGAKVALDNGIRLIQLRMKHCDLETVRQTARRLKEECDKAGAELIIDDYAEIAAETGACGVHLGQTDEEITVARQKLTGKQIIGLTCNTFEQVFTAVKSGADYLGVGPYRFTRTKEKLSPVLGVDGYRTLIAECRKHNIHIPVYAIGGICLEDVKGLMEAGVYGIAVSSLILEASDPEETIRKLRKEITQCQTTIHETGKTIETV